MLHTAFGIAERKAPKVALVNYGINMDVGEVGADVLTPTKSTGLVQDNPRPRVPRKVPRPRCGSCQRRPDCQLFRAGRVEMEHAQNTCAFDEYRGTGRI